MEMTGEGQPPTATILEFAPKSDVADVDGSITPEMISAGVAAFDLYAGSVDAFLLVQEVYKAMAASRV